MLSQLAHAARAKVQTAQKWPQPWSPLQLGYPELLFPRLSMQLGTVPIALARSMLNAQCFLLTPALSSPACFSAGFLQVNMQSKANGALMRVTPLAVWGHKLSQHDLVAAAVADAQLTHPNKTCLVSIYLHVAYIIQHVAS